MNDKQMKAEAFYEAALFLKDKIENGGWKKFSSNYLREHVRCRFGFVFSNTESPEILREVIRQHPELGQWITINARKGEGWLL
jgi:hypothetical protein